jgi:hypothetical protein
VLSSQPFQHMTTTQLMTEPSQNPLQRLLTIAQTLASFALLSAVGAGIYALLRQGYLRFYSRFATTPEDVGVTQLQMLAGLVRSWRAGLAVVASLLLLIAVLFFISGHAGQTWVAIVVGLVAGGVAVAALVGVLQIPARFEKAVEKVQAGQPIVSSAIPLIAVQAFPADLAWMGDKPAPAELRCSHTLMYLGHANGRALLYDYHDGTTWTVSEDTIVIRVRTRPSTPAMPDSTCGAKNSPNP